MNGNIVWEFGCFTRPSRGESTWVLLMPPGDGLSNNHPPLRLEALMGLMGAELLSTFFFDGEQQFAVPLVLPGVLLDQLDAEGPNTHLVNERVLTQHKVLLPYNPKPI